MGYIETNKDLEAEILRKKRKVPSSESSSVVDEDYVQESERDIELDLVTSLKIIVID